MLRSFRNALFRPHWKKLLWIGLLAWWWHNLLPEELFDDPVSMVLEDQHGNLLGARIAADGQWRFPERDSVPEKFKKALLEFEDKYFYVHCGVDLSAMGRAMLQNLRNGRVVSGGSTLTMQLVRLMRKGRPRTVFEKAIEAVMAIRLEMRYSKDKILSLYASHAPFGGNVVGLDAAAWRYFGRGPDQLSWAEAATLAVLPNSPSLIHPGKNRDRLRAKRDRLLHRMADSGILDSVSLNLAKMEPLPDKPHKLPNLAPHLLERIRHERLAAGQSGARMRTTIDLSTQLAASDIVQRHHRRLLENSIHNAAALILEVETGDVVAYVGNVRPEQETEGHEVDIIRARRSTGSILKPFLYAAMLDDGELLPNTLVPDIPTYFGNYNPKNFNPTYDGAVPAKRALARSLNVPAIRMLHDYGHARFYHRLQDMGMTTLDQSPDHYGLSLILGGAEASLWDLAGMYASMARSVNGFRANSGQYAADAFRPARYVAQATDTALVKEAVIGAGASYATFEAMLEVTRPFSQGQWEQFSSARKIAWKTGTSYGYRDAWAIGTTPTHVVAVWAGNADGEGRPGLIGLHAAAPLMFELFDMLRLDNQWFEEPLDDLETVAICKQSGHRASDICDKTVEMRVPRQGTGSSACPYHSLVHLDATGQFQVHGDCASPFEMTHKAWFQLPPAQEEWYRKKHADYRSLPPWRADCREVAEAEAAGKNMEFIYPRTTKKVFIPTDLDGTMQRVVFEVAHRSRQGKIYWHLDDQFLGITENIHQMALNPEPGVHVLTLVDESGEELRKKFEAVGEND